MTNRADNMERKILSVTVCFPIAPAGVVPSGCAHEALSLRNENALAETALPDHTRR